MSITNTVINQLQSFIFRFLKLKQRDTTYVYVAKMIPINWFALRSSKLGLNSISSLHSQSSVSYQGASMTEAFITIRIIEVKLYFLTVNLNKKRVKD